MEDGSKIPAEVKVGEHASNQSDPNTTSEEEYLQGKAKEDENQPAGVGTIMGPELVHSTTPEREWTLRGSLFTATSMVDSETDGSIRREAGKPAKEPEM
jgi:hypothetical protein